MFERAKMEEKLVAILVDPQMPLWIVIRRDLFEGWLLEQPDELEQPREEDEDPSYFFAVEHFRVSVAMRQSVQTDESKKGLMQFRWTRCVSIPSCDMPRTSDQEALAKFLDSFEAELLAADEIDEDLFHALDYLNCLAEEEAQRDVQAVA